MPSCSSRQWLSEEGKQAVGRQPVEAVELGAGQQEQRHLRGAEHRSLRAHVELAAGIVHQSGVPGRASWAMVSAASASLFF